MKPVLPITLTHIASCLFDRSRVDLRVVFKITGGSKQRLDKLLFLWFVFFKICLKNWTVDTNFQVRGSTDKIIQNFRIDSVIYESPRAGCHGKLNLSHVASVILHFKPVVQCSDCTTLLPKNSCYINSSSAL